MALPNGVRVDEEGNVVFEGRCGQTLLLHVLLRVKYAKPFEPLTFLNEWIADLIRDLDERSRSGLSPQPSTAQSPLFGEDPQTRQDIAGAILADASHTGWWTWSRDEQAQFIRDVACAPHKISEETVEEVILSIEDQVESARKLVAAADQNGHS